MTQDEIIAMAKAARISEMGLNIDGSIHLLGLFERFAALVAAKRDEENAQLCESVAQQWGFHMVVPSAALQCAAAIRARGTKEGA